MSKYEFVLSSDDFEWSHSRIQCACDCKYAFFLKYLYHGAETPLFFNQYGSFMHTIHELIYKGFLSPDEAKEKYLTEFNKQVTARAPSGKIFTSYFNDGLKYWSSFENDTGKILAVEKEMRWSVDRYSFLGYLDLLDEKDGKLRLTDHKARKLSLPSGRKKPTVNDLLLDKYFKQLYLYCTPIEKYFSKKPDILRLNCYRNGTVIERKFDEAEYQATLEEIKSAINDIIHTETWQPNIDQWQCRYLCSMCNECDYLN